MRVLVRILMLSAVFRAVSSRQGLKEKLSMASDSLWLR